MKNTKLIDRILTEKEQEQINSLKNMMPSCFAYGGIEKDSYNYKKYIEPIGEGMNKGLFNFFYNQQKSYLELTFKVEFETSVDSEGGMYNSLVKI